MLLLKNATIYPQTDAAPFVGDILCDGGKIVKIGTGLTAEAETLDLTGLHLLPGLIDCHTHISLQDPCDPRGMKQITETTHPVTPQFSSLYNANPTVLYFPFAVKNGVTTVGIIPGSANVIGGSGFASKTWGDDIFAMSIRDNICMKAALGENPKGRYQSAGQEPDSRMGATFLLAEFLHDAYDYFKRKEAGDKELKLNAKFEAAIPLFKGEIPLRIHCTHNDMASAIQIATEFGIKFTLEHAWGSMCYLNEIVDSGCGIVYGPIGGRRSFYESRRTDIEAAGVLDQRGVVVALTTDSPILGFDGLLNEVEEAVREGADPLRAMRMVTINPAKILGVEDRVGSVEVGKDANFAIFNAIPGVDMCAHVVYTVCEGVIAYQG